MRSGVSNRPSRVDFRILKPTAGTDPFIMHLAGTPPPDSVIAPSEPPSGIRVRPCTTDEQRFTAFVRSQIELVPKYARRLRVPEHEAEDILQLSLEKLCAERAAVESSRWGAWLWNAMHLRRLMYFRGVRRAQRHEPDITFLLQVWQGYASPEIETHQRECARELLALLGRLTPERREVVCLYLIDDLPMHEVAERLGIPLATAKNRWRLACVDMGLDWERQQANARWKLSVATFLSAIAAFFAAFFRRLAGARQERRGALLACAACALVLPAHEEPVQPGGRHEVAHVAMASYREESGARAQPSPVGEPAAPTPATAALTDVTRDVPPRANRPASHMPRRLLVNAQTALQEGNLVTARWFLAEYITTFPHNPHPEQYASLKAAVDAR